jgi:hypothetical protein
MNKFAVRGKVSVVGNELTATPFREGRVNTKIPIPPQGYIKFKSKNRSTGHGKDDDSSMPICPYCENASGYSSGDTFYTDPLVQKEYERDVDDDVEGGFDSFCRPVKGVGENEPEMLKCHWSRLDGWVCMDCGGVTLQDWDSGYPKGAEKWYDSNYYWNPLQKVKKVPKIVRKPIDYKFIVEDNAGVVLDDLGVESDDSISIHQAGLGEFDVAVDVPKEITGSKNLPKVEHQGRLNEFM